MGGRSLSTLSLRVSIRVMTVLALHKTRQDEANQRMDIIGQNGPTGEHYDKNQTELEL